MSTTIYPDDPKPEGPPLEEIREGWIMPRQDWNAMMFGGALVIGVLLGCLIEWARDVPSSKFKRFLKENDCILVQDTGIPLAFVTFGDGQGEVRSSSQFTKLYMCHSHLTNNPTSLFFIGAS